VRPGSTRLIVTTSYWQPAYKRQIAPPTSQAFAGEVVKPWYVQEEAGYLSIDDGSGRTAVTFSIKSNMYWNIRLGDKVQVTVNPRLGLLRTSRSPLPASSGPYPP
jgi:hypothetical protein